MKEDEVYIKHILDAISAVEKFLAGKDYNSFAFDKLIQDGVIRELEVIGEASKHFSENFKNDVPSVPWKDIAGMRDKLIHDYFSVDIDAVWKTATEDIFVLKSALQNAHVLHK